MVAATGRLSSADPNLQNIPIRTDAGRRIRGCFVVGEGALGDPAHRGLQPDRDAHHGPPVRGRLDPIEAFRSGEDLQHDGRQARSSASRPPMSTPKRCDGASRRCPTDWAYGLGSIRPSRSNWASPPEEARVASCTEYFTRFGGVRDYLAEVVERGCMHGYTETILGRRRYLPDLNSDNRQRREMAERMALNAPIQGSAADIVKVAMIEVRRRSKGAGLSAACSCRCTTNWCWRSEPGRAGPVEELAREEMGGAYPLTSREVSVGYGGSGEAVAHCGRPAIGPSNRVGPRSDPAARVWPACAQSSNLNR